MRHVVVGFILSAVLAAPAFAQQAARSGAAAGAPAKKSAGAGPVLVIETVKGTVEIETYPQEAPKTVEHILALVNRRFYNGLRVHRVVKGFVVQFGDPQTRDMSKRDRWGTQGSGKSIGVGEFSPKRTHVRGAVAIAHTGDAKVGDSQMYITLAPTPRLNNSYTVFAQVISGMDVVDRLAETDVIRRVTVRVEAPAAK